MIVNSTVAFNKPTGLDGSLQPVELESSIVADGLVLSGSLTKVTGANNQIPFSSGSGTLSGTITACPMLGPLADNGGSTPTHALLHASPAIDAGNNFLGFANDQREGFERVFGIRADIGAFEWQGVADDAVFRSGFEPLDACGQ